MSMIRSLRSASGRKVAGCSITPLPRCHRTNASTPMTRWESRATTGWYHGIISPAARPARISATAASGWSIGCSDRSGSRSGSRASSWSTTSRPNSTRVRTSRRPMGRGVGSRETQHPHHPTARPQRDPDVRATHGRRCRAAVAGSESAAIVASAPLAPSSVRSSTTRGRPRSTTCRSRLLTEPTQRLVRRTTRPALQRRDRVDEGDPAVGEPEGEGGDSRHPAEQPSERGVRLHGR